MNLNSFDKVCIILTVVFLLTAMTFAVWKYVFTSKCTIPDCPQIQHVIYKGVNRGADVYYALNREKNTFQTMTPTYDVLTETVKDITAQSFIVTFNYNGIKVQTKFTKGPILESAVVVIDVNLPSQKTIDLKLTTFENLGDVLRTAGGIK